MSNWVKISFLVTVMWGFYLRKAFISTLVLVVKEARYIIYLEGVCVLDPSLCYCSPISKLRIVVSCPYVVALG